MLIIREIPEDYCAEFESKRLDKFVNKTNSKLVSNINRIDY